MRILLLLLGHLLVGDFCFVFMCVFVGKDQFFFEMTVYQVGKMTPFITQISMYGMLYVCLHLAETRYWLLQVWQE